MGLVALGFLNQEVETGGTMLVDSCNGFNELSRLVMLRILRHLWPAWARFALNYYNHWAQILLPQTGELPVTMLSREGVTQGDPPLGGTLWYHPHPIGRGASKSRHRDSLPILCRQYGI